MGLSAALALPFSTSRIIPLVSVSFKDPADLRLKAFVRRKGGG